MGHFNSPNQETVKILRSQLRELEMADDAGDVGSIRRRRRPRVSNPSQMPLIAHSRPSPLSGSDTLAGQQSSSDSSGRSSAVNGTRSSETEVTASSPRIDSHPMDAPHQRLRRDSISGEQQHSPSTTSETPEEEANASGSSKQLGSSSTAVGDGQINRPPEPQYYVGEVFRHKIYRYTGAIYGYDLSKCSTKPLLTVFIPSMVKSKQQYGKLTCPHILVVTKTECEAEEGWIRSMSVDSSLAYGRHQPFYTALLSDGSRRYVAQENVQVLFREYRRGADTIPLADQIQGFGQLASSSSSSSSAGVPLIPNEEHTAQGSTPGPSVSSSSSSSGTESHIGSAGEPLVIEGVEAVENDAEAGAEESASAAAPPVIAAPTPSITPLTLQFSELGPLGIETVGQYFEAWDGQRGHYVMNRELVKVYPTEDYL